MVVVLPLVPVTPSTRIARDGWPYSVAATGPSARAHAAATRAWATSSGNGRSTSSATAPRGHRVGARGRGRRSPRRGCTRSTRPGATWRLSWVIAATSTSGSPCPTDLVPGPVETGEQVVPAHACASSRVGHGIGTVRVPGTGSATRDAPLAVRAPSRWCGTRS